MNFELPRGSASCLTVWIHWWLSSFYHLPFHILYVVSIVRADFQLNKLPFKKVWKMIFRKLGMYELLELLSIWLLQGPVDLFRCVFKVHMYNWRLSYAYFCAPQLLSFLCWFNFAWLQDGCVCLHVLGNILFRRSTCLRNQPHMQPTMRFILW